MIPWDWVFNLIDLIFLPTIRLRVANSEISCLFLTVRIAKFITIIFSIVFLILTKYIIFSFANVSAENGRLAYNDFCYSSQSISFTTEKQCYKRNYLNVHFKSDLEGGTAGFSGYFTAILKGNLGKYFLVNFF